jgi:hypothetical protein
LCVEENLDGKQFCVHEWWGDYHDKFEFDDGDEDPQYDLISKSKRVRAEKMEEMGGTPFRYVPKHG